MSADERTYTQYKNSDDYLPYLWNGDYQTSLKYLQGFEVAEMLKKIITGKFFLKIKFSNIRSNIYLNGKPIIIKRNRKEYPSFVNGCKLVEGTPHKYGGSNKYPHPSFEEGYCIVDVTCTGFPAFSEWESQYKVEVLIFQKIE